MDVDVDVHYTNELRLECSDSNFYFTIMSASTSIYTCSIRGRLKVGRIGTDKALLHYCRRPKARNTHRTGVVCQTEGRFVQSSE